MIEEEENNVSLLAQAAFAAANAAVANKFNAPQPLSPQLGRDIDERDRQSSTTMSGDIDERPSEGFNRLPSSSTTNTNSIPNLGLFQSTPNLISPTSSSSSSVTVNDDQLKTKTVQDLFRTTKATTVDTLQSITPNNTSVGPSFDFISMLEQLKQPRQTQST